MIRQGYEHHRIHRPLFKSKLYKKVKKVSYKEMCGNFNNVIELVDLVWVGIQYNKYLNLEWVFGEGKVLDTFEEFYGKYKEAENCKII